MRLDSRLWLSRSLPLLAVCGVLAACASDGTRSAASAATSPASPELAVITVTPELRQQMQRESVFRQLDEDGDGALSAAEAGGNPKLLQAFRRLDVDRDGALERDEFARVHFANRSGSASVGGTSSP